MRKMIFLIQLVLVSFLLVGTSCEKQKFEIYENRVIACCSVSNPTENLVWLNTLIKDIPSTAAFSIKLYENNADHTLNIVTEDHIFTMVYDCDGNNLFGGHYSGETGKSTIQSVAPAPCSECKEFFNTHHFVGLIYEKKIVE
jgi:hypothetical protein